MITDEQIKALAVARGFKLTNETGDDLKPYVYEFARELIALAQQVKPLEFKKENGVYFLNTCLGQYHIASSEGTFKHYVIFKEYAFPYYETCYTGILTEQDAISIAQTDFNKRVLENLVHGG